MHSWIDEDAGAAAERKRITTLQQRGSFPRRLLFASENCAADASSGGPELTAH